jgi:hypothetical protein
MGWEEQLEGDRKELIYGASRCSLSMLGGYIGAADSGENTAKSGGRLQHVMSNPRCASRWNMQCSSLTSQA